MRLQGTPPSAPNISFLSIFHYFPPYASVKVKYSSSLTSSIPILWAFSLLHYLLSFICSAVKRNNIFLNGVFWRLNEIIYVNHWGECKGPTHLYTASSNSSRTCSLLDLTNGISTKREHILGHKTQLSKFKIIKIIQLLLSDHSKLN